MEPSSAKENAPKMERIAPTIHAAKTTETLRPSRAISAGLRKMPVPIMVPTTMAADAHAPRPRTSSSRFSVNSSSPSSCLPCRRARFVVPLQLLDATCHAPNCKGDDRPNHEVPRESHARKLEYAQDRGETHNHSGQSSARVGAAVERAEKKEAQQTAKGQRRHGQPRFEQRAPLHQTEAHQHHAPCERHAAREALEACGVGALPVQFCKIEHARSGQRIQ